MTDKPGPVLTVCPQPSWSYDYLSDPSVPALAKLGETIKYFELMSIQSIDNIKHRKQIGHYYPETALEAMEGVVGFEAALHRYVHKRLNVCGCVCVCVCVSIRLSGDNSN